jgi:DNA adenine methylase
MFSIVKWTGSKRLQAKRIVEQFPKEFGTYYEPFLGGGNVLLEALSQRIVKKAWCGDLCGPLIRIWRCCRDNPNRLVEEYSRRFEKYKRIGKNYYFSIRDRFSKAKNCFDLHFLTRSCYNGMTSFGDTGEFRSPIQYPLDNPRCSPASPKVMERHVKSVNRAVCDCKFLCCDYWDLCDNAVSGDLIYLDPPYKGTGLYFGGFDEKRFFRFICQMVRKGVFVVLSYKDGDKISGKLMRRRARFRSGKSNWSRFKGYDKVVHEMLYLSW